MIETQQQIIQPIPALEPEAAPLVTLTDAAVGQAHGADPGGEGPDRRPARLRLQRRLQRVPLRHDARGPAHRGGHPGPEPGHQRLRRPAVHALLQGSEIDYVDTLMGAGFTVNNPNAVSGCGCGSSFRTEESAGSPGACHH